MNVLQLGRFYPPSKGGIETAIFNIREGLTDHDVQCDVLCCGDSTRSTQETVVHGTIYRAGSLATILSTSISPSMIVRLARIASRYDIIHLHHPDPMASLALWLVRPKAKLVVHWHSDIVRQKIALYFFKALQDWILKRASAVIVTTPPYRHSQFLKSYQDKVQVVPLGIPEEAEPVEQAARERIEGTHRDKKLIFALGRMVYYKGFEYLIRAATLLPQDVHIVIGGDGPLLESLRAMVDKANLSGRVFLPGALSDEQANAYYHCCTAFCLSSSHASEAFAIVQLECMRHSKPIVATTIAGSGVSWVNADCVSGINVAPCEPTKLAEAIRILTSNPALAQRLGQQGQQRFRSTFTRPIMCQRIYNIYTRCLDGSVS